MRRLLQALALCAVAAPAVAQDEPIYAPCLQQFPAPDEFGSASAYVAAMQDAGWTHLTDTADRDRAAPPLAELSAALMFSQRAFETVERTEAFMGRAAERFQRDLEFAEVFTREGVSASILVAEVNPGRIHVNCFFAAESVDGVDELFADRADPCFEGRALEYVAVEVEEPEQTIVLHVNASRFVEDEAIIAPLSVREGISVQFTYAVSQ